MQEIVTQHLPGTGGEISFGEGYPSMPETPGNRALLKDLNKSRKGSFVVIEHNMDFVMDLCHRIMVMVEGRVLAIGTPAEIRGNKEVLDAYLGN